MASKGPETVDTTAVNKQKKTFRKSTYRGIELDRLLEMNMEQLVKLFKAR